MTMKRRTLPAVLVTGGSILVGCGGHRSSGTYYAYGGSSCGSYACDPAYGVYLGGVSNGATTHDTPAFAIVDKNGDARMSGQNGTYYRMNLSAAGTNLQGALEGWSDTGEFPNGTRSTSGIISGHLTPTGLNATVTDRKSQAAAFSLYYRNAYSGTSTLSALAGIWSYNSGGFSITLAIQPDGNFEGTDSDNCTYSGNFGLNDAKVNVYHDNYVRACEGAVDPFSGLAARIPEQSTETATTPTQIVFLADDDDGNFISIDLAQAHR